MRRAAPRATEMDKELDRLLELLVNHAMVVVSGTKAVAEEQTAGRGRLGRAWHSERGAGIYSSIILRPPIPVARAPILTLAAGLALADAVTELTGLPTDLRWPNDVLLNGRKCSGILPE